MGASATAWPILAGLACLFVASGATAADTELPPIRLSYPARPGCPTQSEFLEEARQAAPRLRLASGDEYGRRFIVTFEDDGDGVRGGRLQIESARGTVGARDVHGQSCDEVARVLAFAVALAYDPDASPAAAPVPVPEPPPLPPPIPIPIPIPAPAPPPAPRPAPRPAPVDAAPDSRPSRRWGPTWGSLSSHGSVASDFAAGPTFGAGVSGELGHRYTGLDPSAWVALDFGDSLPIPHGTADVEIRTVLLTFEGCLTPWTVRRRLALGFCAHVEGGARFATGENVTGAHTVVRPWLALGPAAHLRLQVRGPWFVELGGTLFFTAIQDDVDLSPGISVYDVTLVGGRGDLGVGIDFL